MAIERALRSFSTMVLADHSKPPSDPGLSLVGTGTVLDTRRGQYLLTAGHVVRNAHALGRFGFSAGSGEPSIIPRSFQFEIETDLAVAKVETLPELKGVSVLPAGRLMRRTNGVDLGQLFFTGFPAERWYKHGAYGQAVPVFLRGDATAVDNSEHRFVVPYPSTGGIDENGNKVFVNPHGFSGSLLWSVDLDGDRDAMVAGLLVEWDASKEILIAVRSEVVHLFVLWWQRNELVAERGWIGPDAEARAVAEIPDL